MRRAEHETILFLECQFFSNVETDELIISDLLLKGAPALGWYQNIAADKKFFLKKFLKTFIFLLQSFLLFFWPFLDISEGRDPKKMKLFEAKLEKKLE